MGKGMDVGFFDSLIVKAGEGAKQGCYRLTYSCPRFNKAHALTHKLTLVKLEETFNEFDDNLKYFSS